MADYGDLSKAEPDADQRRLGAFALKQFKAYKLAAGKTAKSILISCSTRLAPFTIDEVLEITSYDELHLDKLGDELSALFVIISDTDATGKEDSPAEAAEKEKAEAEAEINENAEREIEIGISDSEESE